MSLTPRFPTQNLKILYTLGSGPQDAISSEALRCVANAMLLLESGRDAWLEQGGGKLAIEILQNPKSTPEFCFLASRMLFLMTLRQNDFLRKTVEDPKVIDTIAAVGPKLLQRFYYETE